MMQYFQKGNEMDLVDPARTIEESQQRYLNMLAEGECSKSWNDLTAVEKIDLIHKSIFKDKHYEEYNGKCGESLMMIINTVVAIRRKIFDKAGK